MSRVEPNISPETHTHAYNRIRKYHDDNLADAFASVVTLLTSQT